MSFFHFDENRCIGCRACVMACKQLHGGLALRRVTALNSARLAGMPAMYSSTACESCPEPRCVEVCPNGAYTKGEDGLVLFEQARCHGSGACAAACPHAAPVLVDGVARRCDMCAGREGGPFCVAACPQRALTLGEERQNGEVGK